MPTYEYECRDCGRRFEHFQAMTAARLQTCPTCGATTLRRLIGAGAGILMAGGGPSDGAGDSPTLCDRPQPCCGRDTPCEHSPKRT